LQFQALQPRGALVPLGAADELTDRSVGTLGDPMTFRNTEKASGPNTRVAIIEAAVRILGRSGPDGLSASSLTREVGISKATLFHHFRSIDEIPLLALEHLALQLQAFAPRQKITRGNAIKAMGEGMRTLIEQRRNFINAYFVFFSKALFDPALRKLLCECGGEARAAIRQIVAAERAGPARKQDTDDIVNMIAIMLDGLALHLLLFDDQRPAMRAWSLFAKNLNAREAKRGRSPYGTASSSKKVRSGRKKKGRANSRIWPTWRQAQVRALCPR
jgi:AcrR family transcriptional regulator